MRENASYLQRLVRHYGVTDDPGCGGYLLPDGTFLDFSEGSGSRSQDHRNITWVLPSGWEGPRDTRWDGLVRVCTRTGMYRWMPESWSIETWAGPTRQQRGVIDMLASVRELVVEAHHGRRHYARQYDPFGRRSPGQDLYEFYFHGADIPSNY